MSEKRTKYIMIRSADLCIKNKTEDPKTQLYSFKRFLEQQDKDTLPTTKIKNINHVILVSLNDNMTELFTRNIVVTHDNYLLGEGLFIKENTILEEVQLDVVGKLYEGFALTETDFIKKLVNRFAELGEESVPYFRNLNEVEEKQKQKRIEHANFIISTYRKR